MEIQGRIVVITGAGSGVGAATAQVLDQLGATVILTGRNEQKLHHVAKQLSNRCDIFTMDVQQHDDVQRVMSAVVNKYGRIDVLINNAGFGLFNSVDDMSVEQMEQMMDTNYFGTVRCTKAVLPYMQRAGTGMIVNVASMAGKMATAKAAAYAASKHAVLGFTNALRAELKSQHIHVAAVNPGPIDTPFLHIADPAGGYAKRMKTMLLTPAQVASAIVDVVQRERDECDLPLLARFGIRLYQLAPRWIDRVGARFLQRK